MALDLILNMFGSNRVSGRVSLVVDISFFSMSRQSLVKSPIIKPESEMQVGVQASEKVAGVLF